MCVRLNVCTFSLHLPHCQLLIVAGLQMRTCVSVYSMHECIYTVCEYVCKCVFSYVCEMASFNKFTNKLHWLRVYEIQ